MVRRTKAPAQILTTVMFTDIVGSTETAAKLGDRDWKRLLAKHHSIMRKELKRHRGREIDTAGDGFFNTFDQPAQAIQCAVAVSERLEPLGVHIRAGVHMGQVEVDGPKVQGIAVNIGARVMSKAGDDEVLVSSTVRDALAGAEVRFADRGTAQLKGVPGEWRLFAVERTPELVALSLGTEPVVAPEPDVADASQARSWIRRPASWAVLAVGAVAAIVGGVLLTRSNSDASFAPVVDSVVRLDPSTSAIIGGANVGAFPVGVAEGEGAVWVANSTGKTITRIDLADSTTTNPGTGVIGDPLGVAIGADSIWITLGGGGEQLLRYEPDGTPRPPPIFVGTGYGPIAFGLDSVWLVNADDGALTAVDPLTQQIRSFALQGVERPQDLVIAEESIWVTDDLGEQVVRFDPGTERVAATIDLDGAPSGIAAGDGSLWVTMPETDSVVRIDPGTERGVETIEAICDNPRGIAVGAGSVWVTCANDGVIARIATDETTDIDRVRLGSGLSPEGVTVTDDSVWVTIHAR